LLQRSNGSGGFSGSGLNITTRVSKSIMDAYTHPNWYPIGYVSDRFQFTNRFFSPRFRGCEYIVAMAKPYLRALYQRGVMKLL
jgi:hypothetical protein